MITTTGTDGWRFDSAEAANIDNRPLLEVTFAVPEPTLALTFAAAGAVLVLRRRSA